MQTPKPTAFSLERKLVDTNPHVFRPEAVEGPEPTRSPALGIMMPMAVCIGIYLLGLLAPKVLGRSTVWIFLPGFFTESIILACSLALSVWLTKGRLSSFGFTAGSFRLSPRFFLWVLPTAAIAMLQVVGSTGHSSLGPANASLGSPLSVILTVWIYASISEEIFTRGLLQSCLSPVARYRVRLLRRWPLTLPVLLSALFFSAMHVVLWSRIGAKALGVMFLALILGLIAGYYREKTGSLIPAIMVHTLFDIGGSLPLWLGPLLFFRRM